MAVVLLAPRRRKRSLQADVVHRLYHGQELGRISYIQAFPLEVQIIPLTSS